MPPTLNHGYHNGVMHTCTSDSIPTVSLVTGTGVATNGVGTASISVTVISTSGTLINICNSKCISIILSLSYIIEGLLHTCTVFSKEPLPQSTTARYVGGLLTGHTGESISSVALVTGTGEATSSVGTGSISVTVIITTTCKVLLC